MRIYYTLICFCFVGLAACKNKPLIGDTKYLSAKEKFYCDSMQIDTSVLTDVRELSASPFEPFHYSASTKMGKNGDEIELDPIHLQGFVFNAPNNQSLNIVLKLQQTIKQKGCSIFLLKNNFGIQGKPDVIGIMKTTDKYEVLRQVKTDGINYGITTDSLLKIIKVFDEKYSLELVGAGEDWCQFTINKEPADWLTLAKEAYKACPDIVDQGAGTVEALAAALKQGKGLYFWWD